MLQWFFGKRQKGVAWLLLFVMIFSMGSVVPARAAYKKLGLFDDYHDPVYNTFVIYGRHLFNDGDVWTYRTKAFNVANKKCADITNPPEGVKVARLNITHNLSSYESFNGEEYTISTYKMAGGDFANAFQKLYAEDIAAAASRGEKSYTASMYFNNIFQVVHRTDPGLTEKVDEAPMYPQYSFMSSEEYHTAAALANNKYVTSWSASDFSGFYNYEFSNEFTVDILEATINYVDKENGEYIKKEVAKEYGLKNGYGSFAIPEKTITVDDKTYTFDNSYLITYKNGMTPALRPSANDVLSWTFYGDVEIDACFKEDDSKKHVPVKINIETSRNGTDYRTVKSFDSAEKIYSKEKFTYTPDAMYQDEEGNNYTYIKKWYYTYTDPDGNSKKVDGKTGDYPSIYPVPEVKNGTTLNVYVRYDMEETQKPVPVWIYIETGKDKSTYNVAKFFESESQVYEGDTFTYAPSATYQNENGDVYSYEKKWRYVYTVKAGHRQTVNSSGDPVKFIVPEVKEDTAIAVYVQYLLDEEAEEKTEVPVRINIETAKEGNAYTVAKTFDSGAQAYVGDAFAYAPDETYKDAEGKTYSYEKKWRYVYTDKSGSKKTVDGTGDTPSFTVPEVKDGTYLDVYVSYLSDEKPKLPVDIQICTQITKNGKSFSLDKTAPYGTGYSLESFNYTPPETYVKGEDTYNYMSSWLYSYINPNGERKNGPIKSGNPDIPYLPKTKSGTTLDVYVRYVLEEAEVPGEPTSTPVPEASPSPTPTPMPEKAPSSNQEAPPNEGSLSREVAAPTSAAEIKSEVKFNKRYDVEWGGIATQEDLYAEGKASEFTLGYDLYHVTGTKTYPITVKKTYILQWEGPDPEEGELDENGEEKEPEILTEEVTLATVVNVTRGYGYWEIGDFSYYIADSMKLHNYALPNGTITMPVIQSKINPPAAYSGDYPDNMDDPDAYKNGINLPSETITGDGKDKPVIPRKAFETLAYNAAHEQTGNVKVRNDYLYYWNGTVLDASWTEYSTQTVNPYPLNRYIGETLGGIFYQGEMVIDATKDNGTHQSSGLITYKASPASVSAGSSKTYILTNGPNPVILHTPVYCKGVITEDNDKYVQKPDTIENIVHLVLDEASTLNDFNVRVDNTGPHIQQQGYFTRDYSRILRLPDSDLSNIEKDAYGNLRNDVKFPFDVYMDVGNDYDTSNDVFYHAGTWFTLGRVTQRFYLPLTVREGIYAAEFRTIAVNANGRLKNTQANANTDSQYYVASDSVPIEVSGRLYGLNVYDITDYPIWEEVFRIPGQLHLKLNHQDRYPLGVYSDKYSADKSYNYTVGTKDQYGNETGRSRKYTLPLVGGSHPRYGNIGILKRGYTVRFSVDTIGTYYNDSASVVATPTYYWVDKNGQNRTKVDMYYSAEVQGKSRALIKSGESIDLANVVRYTAGDRKLAIPEDELSITAAIRNLFEWQWEWYNDYLVYGTARTQMGYVFRTFTGNRYADSILSGPNKNRVLNAGITKADLTITKQSWYGETFIPGTARFVDAGFDVFGYAKRQGIDYTESFWKKDGYIIMNLDIRAYQSPGEEYLSYTNRQNEDKFCNMWKLEGGQTAKSDKGRVALYFEPGDFMIYSVEQSAIDDYVVGGIY